MDRERRTERERERKGRERGRESERGREIGREEVGEGESSQTFAKERNLFRCEMQDIKRKLVH